MSLPRRLAAVLPLLLAAAPATPLTPGAWEMTTTFSAFDISGAKTLPGVSQTIPAPKPRTECLTASDLQDPRHLFLAGPDVEQSCHFTRFAMADGRIDAAGDCANGRGETMHVEGTGSYTAAGYDFDFAGSGKTGPATVRFRGRDSGRRTGVCSAF